MVRTSSFLDWIEITHATHYRYCYFVGRLCKTVAYCWCSGPSWAVLAHNFVGVVVNEVEAVFIGRKTSARVHDFHGKRGGINERFDSRSYLALALTNVVVAEMFEIDTAYPSFHEASTRVNGDHTSV